jgi:hypothetical protein
MTWKHYLGITLVSLIVLVILSSFQTAPGYMDAEYYFGMGLRIANGEGFTEPFIWNYLTDVESIPHPGFSYWMPLPALISAAGIWITGSNTFTGGKVIHLLLAALIPALTIKVTKEITQDKSIAFLAGLLAIFPVFYNIFLVTTDSFGIIMLLGGIFYLLSKGEAWYSILGLGMIAGLMHLSRADGMLWVVAGVYVALMKKERRWTGALTVFAGYFLVMAFWFTRNYIILGRLMPAGLSSSFWFLEYNDIFRFSSADLSFQNWISRGIPAILRTYLEAGLANLMTSILVQGQIIMMPLIVIGAWRHRHDKGLQAVFLVWASMFLVMSLVFPFAGMRGGFLHSSAAYQTFLWGLGASGFYAAIDWGVRRRNWTKVKAGFVFGSVLVMMTAIAAGFVYSDRVIGGDVDRPVWNQSQTQAKQVDNCLQEVDPTGNGLILINNPPGFYVASGRSSIVIPNGDVSDILAAGNKFGAQLLVLEGNHPQSLAGLFADPLSSNQMEYIKSCAGAQIFQLPE